MSVAVGGDGKTVPRQEGTQGDKRGLIPESHTCSLGAVVWALKLLGFLTVICSDLMY